MIDITILGIRSPQRFAVRRAVIAACERLERQYPDLCVSIAEVKDLDEIEKVTKVITYPTLVVNGKLVCVGRIPKREEIIAWLQAALNQPN